MQIRLNDHEEDLAKSLRLVHHLAGLYPKFPFEFHSIPCISCTLERPEPTGVWFSATPPVGQGMGLFQVENQEKRGTPTNSSGIFLFELSKATNVCVGDSLQRSRGFFRLVGSWV